MITMSPCLMYKQQAEEAAQLYKDIFPGSEILGISRYTEEELKDVKPEHRPGPPGLAKVVVMKINGMKFNLANGGSFFEFNHGVSYFVECKTQLEIDQIWDKILKSGGTVEQCGWIRDKFGVPWQIVPAQMEKWMTDTDAARSARVSKVIYKSVKLKIDELQRAYDGK